MRFCCCLCTIYVSGYLYIFLLSYFILSTYHSSPIQHFHPHRKCQVSFLFLCLLIILASYFFLCSGYDIKLSDGEAPALEI